jgi:hypothetical protein
MNKPWWEYLLELLAGLLTKGQLEAAGAGPDALQGAATTMLDLPTLSGLQGPPRESVHRSGLLWVITGRGVDAPPAHPTLPLLLGMTRHP